MEWGFMAPYLGTTVGQFLLQHPSALSQTARAVSSGDPELEVARLVARIALDLMTLDKALPGRPTGASSRQ